MANNTRLLVLPGPRVRNLGSRVLGLCARRIVRDWPARFGHRLVLRETFVDPSRFAGTVYRAANWRMVGHTLGFRRRGHGYDEASTPKCVFVYPLVRDVHRQLSGPTLDPTLAKGAAKTMLSAAQMRSLPEYFADIDDPRTRAGRRHSLSCILALASAATLCGARGYKAIGEWVDALGCCFSLSLVESPGEFAGLFRRRIAWDDTAGSSFEIGNCVTDTMTLTRPRLRQHPSCHGAISARNTSAEPLLFHATGWL